MILLTSEEILALHTKLIEKTGGTDGLKDNNLFESAIASMYAGYENYEHYKTVEEKSARLCYSLIANHAFIDGNKRIGILAMLVTLKLNHIELKYTQNELVTLGLGVADATLGYDEIYEWVISHKVEK